MIGEAPSMSGGAQDSPTRHWLSDQAGTVALIWFASRVSVMIAAAYSTWVLTGQRDEAFSPAEATVPPLGPVATWNQWDLEWYISIARDGYGAPGFESSYAFLPGLPGLLWALGKVNIHPTLAGLLISAAAGFVAALALSRLAADMGGRGELAVTAWVLAPAAVFLAAPYTEALFCAFAFWAWAMARHGVWWAAALLAAGASLVRINGLGLACALVVLFATSRGRRRDVAWLLVPFATMAGLHLWFRAQTGSWTAWLDAESSGWHRQFTNPVDSLRSTIDYAFNNGLNASYNVQYKWELASMAVIIAFGLILLVMRWWGEATYVLLTALALGTSTTYYSVPRATLVLFPIWVLIGIWMTRRRWALISYVAVSAPIMLVGVIGFVNGRWIA